MQTFKSYVYNNGKHDFRRAYRETLICQMINTFEKNYTPDGAKGLAGYQKSYMSVSQKRRLRTEIVKKTQDYVKQHPDASIYDTDVIENAFFDTSYGKLFSGQRADWEKNDKQRIVRNVESWTTGQSSDSILRFTISPYDPTFADSELFADNEENAKYTDLAYVIGASKANGRPGILKSAVKPSGQNQDDDKVYMFAPDPANAKDLYINAAYRGRDGELPLFDENNINKFTKGDPKPLYGVDVTSGYSDISHFIKTNIRKKEIHDYLVKQTTGDNPPLSSDERKFMKELCEWLSVKGMDFEIKVEKNGADEYLVASLGSRKNIRMLDRENPQYQGRILDNGNIIYPSISIGVQPNDPAYKKMQKYITADNKLDAIKWYFGEDVPFRNESSLSGYNDEYIGSIQTLQGNKKEYLLLAARGDTNTTSTVYRSKSDKTISVAVGIKDADHEIRSGVSRTDALPIRVKVTYPNQTYTQIIPTMNDGYFERAGAAKTLSEKIPLSQMYPDDIVDKEVPVLNDEGEPTGETTIVRGLTDTIPESHRDYYRTRFIHNTLSDWVDSAKKAHADAVNIDDIVQCYQNYYAEGNGYEYQFSGDDRIAEIQKLYWDTLTGVKDIGKSKKKNDDESELDAFDESVFNAPFEEKVKAIKEHYNNYVENTFGRVPEMQMPFLSDEENAEIVENNKTAGFDPTMVARYANNDESMSVQRNYDYIRHMLYSLDDEYNPGYIKDGTYMANEIKNNLIKYNPETAVCQNNYNNVLGRNTGIMLRQIMDDNINDINYDALYELAPSLREKPVTTEMLLHTAKSLMNSGCDVNSIELNVDDNGIISYKGAQLVNITGKAKYDISKEYPPASKLSSSIKEDFVTVSGQIGQIFEPDENGVIIPNYGSQQANKVIIPGYNAYFVPNDPDNPTSARERLRLSDWRSQMKSAITEEIHRGTMGNPSQYKFIPHTTSLNHVYRHTYDTEMTVEEYHDKLDPSKSSPEEVETFKATIETLKGRCRFPNEYGEGSTTMAQSMIEHPTRKEAKDFDYYYYDLCGGNLRVLDDTFDGIFDRRATGTAKTQGLVRYLASGVKVDSDTGKVIPIENYDPKDPPRCALMNDSLFKYADHNTWDRLLMSSNQLLTALRTPRDVGVVMGNLNGDTFDDGMTVSKAFAEKYKIKGADGNMRALMPQDKLSEMNGNKGVITRVVDPDQYSENMIKEVNLTSTDDPDKYTATYRDKTYTFKYNSDMKDENGESVSAEMQAVKAIQKKLCVNDDICKFFADNPKVEVVMSPYSGMSRSNGGSIAELMSKPDNIKVNGKVIEGGMGHMNMIVVDMPADVKTHWYDDDAIREGKGRKSSGQLLWILNAMGADKIINEFYGSNNKAWDNLREYAIAIGTDITEDITPVVGYHEQTRRNEHRKLFTMPDDEIIKNIGVTTRYNSMNLNDFKRSKVSEKMLSEMNKSGGFMELPFQLDFKTLSHMKMKKPKADPDWFMLQETGNTYKTHDGEKPTYGMPVLPPSLRSGQDFKDGTSRDHDYTIWYQDIHTQSVAYRVYENKADELKEAIDAGELDDKTLTDYKQKIQLFEDKKEEAKTKAQASFDKIVNDIVDKQFDTKYNIFREQCMAVKIPSSATAVVAAGIDLKSDEIAMSEENAVKLGIMSYDEEKDEYYWSNRKVDKDGNVTDPGNGAVLLWRDPVLRTGAARYMNVKIDNSVLGIRMNPAMDKSHDGDFDGDSYGLCVLKTKAAQAQAFAKFHISNNLLDLGNKDSKTGKYPLFINSGMDMASNAYADKSGKITAMRDALEDKANMLQAAVEKIEAGEMSVDDFKYEARVPKRCKSKSGRYSILRDDDGNTVYETNPDGSYKTEMLSGKKAMTACRCECKEDLDEYLFASFKGILISHIVVKSPETVVQSFQQIVDCKAKGDAKKMRELMDKVGIDYVTDDKGNAIASSAKLITHKVDGKEEICPRLTKEGELSGHDLVHEENMRIAETAAYKADNTSLGGVSSQNGVAAFRNYVLMKILELTYPTTQGILQSKKDPKDAKVKDETVRFWGHDVWDGYKLTGDWSKTDPAEIQKQTHERIEKIALDDEGQPIKARERIKDPETGEIVYRDKLDRDGNPVYETYYEKCTKEEWVTQMKAMMKVLKVDVNEDYIKDLADMMERKQNEPLVKASDGCSPIKYYKKGIGQQPAMGGQGTVMGVTEFAEKNGALIDKIAYSGRVTAFVNAALSNDERYKTATNYQEKSSGSIIGNAPEKLVEIHDMKMKAIQCSETERRAIMKAASEKIKFVDQSGIFVANSVIEELSGDKYRAETGNNFNVIPSKNGPKKVAPKPLGRKDCIVSEEDYNAGTCQVMGESKEAYQKRLARALEAKSSEGLGSDSIPLEKSDTEESVQTQDGQSVDNERNASKESEAVSNTYDTPFDIKTNHVTSDTIEESLADFSNTIDNSCISERTDEEHSA